VKSHQRLGDEYDVQTVDRGTAHHCIVSNLFYNGQLLLTRTVPYLEKTPADYVRALMDAHNTRLLDELVDGQLDEEIKGVLTAVHARPIEPTLTPMAMPAAGARPAATPPTVTIREGTPRVILMGFAAPSDFLAVHSTRQQQSGLLVDSPLDVALGDKVEVILRFGGQPLRQFMLHGAVAWRRRKSSETLKAAFGVDFPASQKVPLEHVVEFALGIHDVATMRQHPRVRCAFPVKFTADGGKPRTAILGDLSAGGMFIPTDTPLPRGAGMTVQLKPDGWWFPLKMRGVVMWSGTTERRGMGVRFLFDGDGPRNKLARLVEKLLKV